MKIMQLFWKKLPVFGLLLIGFFWSYSAKAAYLEDIPTSITQPDGRILECFVTGDEFFRRFHDKDGFTIVKNPETRWFVYAVRSGDTLAPTEHIFGSSNPVALGLSARALPSPRILEQKRTEHYRHVPKPDIKKKERLLVSNTGTIQNLVIYIRFADETEFADDTSTYHTMFNASSGNSQLTYFREVSYNTLNIYSSFYPRPSSSIVKSFQDSHNRNYFQPYDVNDNPNGYQNDTEKRNREHALLRDACNGTSSEIPGGLAIDNDGDGYVDNVCFIVKGSQDGWSDLLWPHRWALYTLNVQINGKRVWDYNFQLQNFLKTSGNGVLAHEMFHTLGAPDLYHYNQDGLDPVWRWDVMGSTTNPPQHMGAWMKKTYGGWISNIPEITSNGNYSLNPLTSSTNNAYKIASPNSTTEFFVVEYRLKSGTFESPLPGSGLIVYRITPALEGNADGPPDEIYVYRPNGTTSVRGNPENAHYTSSVGRTEINDNTSPKAFLSDGSNGGLNISSIGAAGGTISFTVGSGAGITIPVLVFPADLAYGIPVSAILRWNRVTGATSYDVQVSRNNGFTDLAYNQTGITDSTVTVSPALNFAQTYYWRVRAVGSQTSEWAAYRTFTTQLTTPTLTSPANSALNIQLTDTLRWQSVSDASYYSVEISLSSNFSSTVLQMSSIGNTFYVIPQGILQNNKVYYWRLQAIKASPYNESGWSEVRSFTTLLATPVLVTPKNDSLGMPLTGLLIWNSVTGASTYNVRLSDDPTYSTTILNQTGVTGTNVPVSSLNFNKKYYWSVQAVAGSQLSAWANSFSFTTKLGVATLIAPANGELNVELNGQLRWNKVTGANSYLVQVASDTNMTQLMIDNSNVTDSNLTMPGLSSITKYTWRVKAKSSDGRTGDWSEKWNFTTKLGPPTIPSPPDSSNDVAVDGMLVWNNVNGATKYHVKLSKSQNLDNLVINDSTLTQTSAAYSVLESDQTYYWTVRSLAGELSSNWSKTWKFKTGIGRVVLMLPEKSSRGNALSGVISWKSMAGATSYNAMIASDVSFSNPILNQTFVNATSLQYSNLQKNTTYYWKVSANSGSEQGQWSLVWDFVTTAGEPVLVSPDNNKGGLALSGNLNWRSVQGATSYTLNISENQDMSNPIVDRTNADTFYLYSGFKNYKTYYWKVRATTSDGTTDWTETRKFTTLIANPELFSPLHQKRDAPTDGRLEWNGVAGATGYTLWVSKNFDFSTNVIEENTLSTEYDYSNLENNRKYFWKVMALNPDANSGWSESREFVTVLASPELSWPENEAVQVPLNARLTWNHVDGYQTYGIKVAKDANFNDIFSEKTGLQFAYYDCTNLAENTRYYWMVNASNQYNTGAWSEVRTFVSKDPAVVLENRTSNFLVDAFPNPFTDKITFGILGTVNSDLKIEIYNYAGILVGEFVVNHPAEEVGVNSAIYVNWSAQGLAQGIYSVVMKSGNSVNSFNIVLIR